MRVVRSVNAILCLPMAMFLWQGSSCRSSHGSSMNNSRESKPSSSPVDNSSVAGMWGGAHISMEVTDGGAEINYDCAHGQISKKIVLDSKGNFQAKGVHVRELPGPVREGEEKEQPALYTGSVQGNTMTLIVKLTETNETIGTFTLTRGSNGQVHKCK